VAVLVGLAGHGEAAQPVPWELGMQPAATPVMERVNDFHNLLLVITGLIVTFIMFLLVFVMLRFNAKANPQPSKTTHNTMLEVVWTVIPIMILLVIAIPSFKLLYYQDVVPEADMTVKAIGHQWYWSYEYPDHGDFTYDSFILDDEDLQKGQPRLLEVDNHLVILVNTTVRVQVTATDVLHSFAVPSFGIKIDAVPGRLNETWLRVAREGMYYGQCSELCGVNHGFMPIAVEVVSKAAFAKWVEQAKKEFASDDRGPAAQLAARPASPEE